MGSIEQQIESFFSDLDFYVHQHYQHQHRQIVVPIPDHVLAARGLDLHLDVDESPSDLKQSLLNILAIPTLIPPVSPRSRFNYNIRRSKTPTKEELRSFFGGIPQLNDLISPQSEAPSTPVAPKPKRKLAVRVAIPFKKTKKAIVPLPEESTPTPAPRPPVRFNVQKIPVLASISTHSASTINNDGPPSPTLAEMDAFFGYKEPSDHQQVVMTAPVVAIIDNVNNLRPRNEDKTEKTKRGLMIAIHEMGRSRESMAILRRRKDALAVRFQLSAMDPTLSANERRLVGKL